MSRIAQLVSVLALAGCAGSVKLEDVDGFGGVNSALWIHWSGEYDFDTITLTNVAGACAGLQDLQDLGDDLNDELEDIDADDYCEDAKEPTQAVARVANRLYHDGAHWISLTVNEDFDTEPDEETYEVGDARLGLSGSVVYYDKDPYASVLADWDEDEDFEDDCGVDLDDLDEPYEYWTLGDGELEITRVDKDTSLSAVLDAELVDDEYDGAGDITASFTATYCELKY